MRGYNMRQFTVYPKNYVSATTKKELEARRRGLRDSRISELEQAGVSRDEIRNAGFFSNLDSHLPEGRADYYKQQSEELSAIDMLHSILTYEPGHTVDSLLQDRYMQDYIKTLGRERVAELCQAELDEYANAKINRDVFVDDEGLSYNSVTFRDDEE